MRIRKSLRALGAATLAAALVLGGSAAAHAVPTPDAGPVNVETTVTLPTPESPKFSKVFGAAVTYALGLDGTTYAWGSNAQGQLGDGTTIDRPNPADPAIITTSLGQNFVDIAGPYVLNHALGLDADGDAFAWGGTNTSGEYGNGTNAGSNSPVEVNMPVGVKFLQISVGEESSLALGDNDTVYAWGRNNRGQIGDGTTTNRSEPQAVVIPAGVGVVPTQIGAGNEFSVALMSDGTVWSWGRNDNGQVGDGTAGGNRPSPTQAALPAGTEIVEISIGQLSTLALDSTGVIWAWGDNLWGTLANGGTTSSPTPTPINEPVGVRLTEFVSTSGLWAEAAFAVSNDGDFYGWGANSLGTIGDGTTTAQYTPVPVVVPAGVTFDEIYPAGVTNFALEADGTPWVWGVMNYADFLGGAPLVVEPAPVRMFDVVVTGVTFDGTAGTNLVDHGDGTFDVDTPALPTPGQVDVVVSWTLNGVAQTPIEYLASADEGFTYYAPAAPAVTITGNQTVDEGQPASFSVDTLTGTPAPTVAWQVSTDGGTTWAAVTAADGVVSPDGLTIDITSAAVSQSGNQYRAVASNGVNPDAESAASTLTVLEFTAPTVTDPADQSTMPGTGVTFSVTADGNPAPAVTWEVSADGGTTWASSSTDPDAVVAGDGLSVTVTPTDLSHDGYEYRAIATNSEGTATSTPATLTVTPAPAAPTVTDPADQSTVPGTGVTFAVTADGHPAPAVTWEVSTDGGATWASISTDPAAVVAGDGLSVTVTPTDLSHDGYEYRAIATNSEGSDTSASATLTVTPAPAAPTVSDPADQSTVPGTGVTFAVTADGNPAPAVTWEVSTDGGATWASISTDPAAVVAGDGLSVTVTPTDLSHDGYEYRAVASNSEGTVTSLPAALTVSEALVAPTVTDPVDAAVVSGDTATFTVTTTGNPSPTVVWEVSTDGGVTWQPITADPAATPSPDGLTLSVVSTNAHDGYEYRATATNSEGTATSTAATLTVTPVFAPTITDPAGASILVGEAATFAVTTAGSPAPTVVWEVTRDGGTTWQPITTDTAAVVASDGLSVTVTPTGTEHDGFEYRAVATNSQGSVISAPAPLTVSAPPVAPTVTAPVDQTITVGETATFAVTVTGSPAPTVAWEFTTDGGATWQSIVLDPTAVVAADGLSVAVTPTSVAQTGYQYRAVVTNSAGTATSTGGALTVNAATGGGGIPDTGITPSVDTSLQVTGGTAPIGLVVLGVLALLLGGGTLAANRIAKRRVS